MTDVHEAIDTHLATIGIDTAPTAPEDEPRGSYIPDPSHVFYHSGGHFHGDYSVVEVSTDRPGHPPTVYVHWRSGLRVPLTGMDAYRFLKLNRSRHAVKFDPARRKARLN